MMMNPLLPTMLSSLCQYPRQPFHVELQVMAQLSQLHSAIALTWYNRLHDVALPGASCTMVPDTMAA